MKSLKSSFVRLAGLAVVLALPGASCFAQQTSAAPASPPGDTTTALRDLQDQVRQLSSLVEQMRSETAESRAEMQQLRHDLQATRALLQPPNTKATGVEGPVNSAMPENTRREEGSANVVPPESAPLAERVQKLEESTALFGSKIDEQYQTKVEAASKYRVRLHGIVLMNAFRNIGASENLDIPTYAESVPGGMPQANVGATLRQSQIGFEVFGPTIGGAHTSADVQFDFAGGFPSTGNGVTFGIVRMETASLRLDWAHTSIIAGQDPLFISPLSPTSFASLATPSFAYGGNLWGWIPQIRAEHRFSLSDQQTLTVEAGLLDNLDWQYPSNSFNREAQAGEMSGQPAYALRTSWSRPLHERPLSLGVAGYYGRQNWAWDRFVDAWAGMADWQVPIAPRLALSGEFYRGRGIGGLGGGIGTSVVYGGNPYGFFTPIRGVETAGGWSQLKLQITPKVEINGVFAEDDSFAGNIRGFATDANNFGPILGRNRGTSANVVFRPRSDLILSAELRRLRSFPVYSSSISTSQVNFSMGILF